MTFQIREPELYWEPMTDTVTVPFFPERAYLSPQHLGLAKVSFCTWGLCRRRSKPLFLGIHQRTERLRTPTDGCGLVTPRACFEPWLVNDVTSLVGALCMPLIAPSVDALDDTKLDEKDENESGCGANRNAHNSPSIAS